MWAALAKRLLLPFHQHHHLTLLRLSFSTQPSKPKDNPFLAKYLVSSFGFSPDRALKVSSWRSLAGVNSSDRPKSIVRFLNDMGLSDSQIKALVSFQPNILVSSVEKTLKPKVRELTDAGFLTGITASVGPIQPVFSLFERYSIVSALLERFCWEL